MSYTTDFVTCSVALYFLSGTNTPEHADVQQLIDTLRMQKHSAGGYFVEIDRDPRIISNPFAIQLTEDETRNLSAPGSSTS